MTPTLQQATAMGQFRAGQAQARAEEHEPGFTELAASFILDHLRVVRRASGEDLVDIARARGARPPDDRAFGSVFGMLSRRGEIRHGGFAPRKKGHGTSGARIWELVTDAA